MVIVNNLVFRHPKFATNRIIDFASSTEVPAWDLEGSNRYDINYRLLLCPYLCSFYCWIFLKNQKKEIEKTHKYLICFSFISSIYFFTKSKAGEVSGVTIEKALIRTSAMKMTCHVKDIDFWEAFRWSKQLCIPHSLTNWFLEIFASKGEGSSMHWNYIMHQFYSNASLLTFSLEEGDLVAFFWDLLFVAICEVLVQIRLRNYTLICFAYFLCFWKGQICINFISEFVVPSKRPPPHHTPTTEFYAKESSLKHLPNHNAQC